MELHKANLEAAQPMVTNPNLTLNQFMPQMHPFYTTGCLPAGQTQLPFGALMAGQQAQLAQQSQQIVTPISTAMQTPAVSMASNILQHHHHVRADLYSNMDFQREVREAAN